MRRRVLLAAVLLLAVTPAVEAKGPKLTEGQARATIRDYAASEAEWYPPPSVYWLRTGRCSRVSARVLHCRVREASAFGSDTYTLRVVKRREIGLWDTGTHEWVW